MESVNDGVKYRILSKAAIEDNTKIKLLRDRVEAYVEVLKDGRWNGWIQGTATTKKCR